MPSPDRLMPIAPFISSFLTYASITTSKSFLHPYRSQPFFKWFLQVLLSGYPAAHYFVCMSDFCFIDEDGLTLKRTRVFCVTCGIVITKADVFPATATAGAGQVLLNITIPCFMFSKIVPAFTTQNIGALGRFHDDEPLI